MMCQSYRLSSKCKLNYTKLVNFYMLITMKQKIVEKFVKKNVVKNTHLLNEHKMYAVYAHWNQTCGQLLSKVINYQ